MTDKETRRQVRREARAARRAARQVAKVQAAAKVDAAQERKEIELDKRVRAAIGKPTGFTPATDVDKGKDAVFVNANRRSALRVFVGGGIVEYIALTEEAFKVDQCSEMAFVTDWVRAEYDVKRAAAAYASAARYRGITEEAKTHLERLLGTRLKDLKTQQPKVAVTTRSKTVMNETQVAGSTSAAAPAAAPLVIPGSKADKAAKAAAKLANGGKKPKAAKAKKAAPKAAKAKKAAPKVKAEKKDRASKYRGKGIKGLVKTAEAAGLRAGTKRAAMLELVLKAKNTDDVLGKTVRVKGEAHEITAANLSGMIERKHIVLT